MSAAPIWVSSVSAVISIVSIIIAFWNINRIQKKNLKNDEIKFKRDLNLKSSDEMIETINQLKHSCRDLVGVGKIYELFLKDKVHLNDLRAYLEKCRNELNKANFLFMSKYQQREIILKKFGEEVNTLYGLTGGAILQLDTLISWHLETGRTDQEISKLLEQINGYSFETINRVNKLQKDLQNEFLGTLYR